MNTAPRKRRLPPFGSTAAIATLILLPLVWLWPHVFGDRLFVPYDVDAFPPASFVLEPSEVEAARSGANLDVTEVPIWFLPELRFAHDELVAGRLPTWNPNARHGAPLHAHGLIGLCYPPNWLALAADAPASRLGLVAWCNLVLGGLMAFGLFRSLGYGALAAWFGAAVFELSLPMAANAFFWMRLGSFVWLPGILWAMHALARPAAATASPTRSVRLLPSLALAVCYAMVWFAGFPPFAASTTVFAGAWFAWLVTARMCSSGPGSCLRLAAAIGAPLVLGAMWSLPQVLPSLAFFPESARPVAPAWSDIAAQAFEPYGLFGFLAPDAFGDPTTQQTLPYNRAVMQLLWNGRIGADGKTALPNYNFTEYSVFVSTFAVVLALFGVLFGSWRRQRNNTAVRRPSIAFVRAALVLGFGLAMFWPIARALFHLPVVQNVWPMRWLAASTLFVVWAAVHGLDRLLQSAPLAPHHGTKRAPLLAAAIALLLGGLLWQASRTAHAAHADPEQTIAALAARYQCDETAVLNHVCGAGHDPSFFQFGPQHFATHAEAAILWLLAAALTLVVFAFVRSLPLQRLVLLIAAAASLLQLTLSGRAITIGTDRHVEEQTEAHTFVREQIAAAQTAENGGFTIVRARKGEGLPSQLGPGLLMLEGLRDLNFYSHADKHTLEPVRLLLERYEEQLGLVAGAASRIAGKGYLTSSLPAKLLQHPLFDLFNVRYALAVEDLSSLGLRKRVGPQNFGRGEFYFYERERALPRAFTVPTLAIEPDDEQLLAKLLAESLQPRAQAYVCASDLPDGFANPPQPTAQKGETERPQASTESRLVRFVENAPTHIELSISAGSDPYLVLGDTFLPGWTAQIDGKATPIVRCNHSQRLLHLPAKACRVTWTYTAPGLNAGFGLAVFATLLAGAALWLLRRHQQRRAAAASP